jgi:hypothetical protein
MKIAGLKNLYKSMKQQNVERYKFDVLYFIDEQPNILAFGIKQHNYYFELPVTRGFEIKPFLHNYNEFCKIMGFKYNPDAPFKPFLFFQEFNKQIPYNALPKNTPKPHEIAVYRKEVDEADKIYFVKWRDNTKAGHQVSNENLEKTRKLLSYKAYIMCKNKNISSCWSSVPTEEKPYRLPN